MTYLTLTETTILTTLRSFLLGILPAGTSVIKGQINRTPEPLGDFVIMTPIRRERIETNTDQTNDAVFVGSAAGTILTVSTLAHGFMEVGATIAAQPGGTITSGSQVTAFIGGSGGTGTYQIMPGQSITSQGLLAGTYDALSPMKLTVQCDVHGPASDNNAQIITALMRDAYGYTQFLAIRPAGDVVPLHADDPRQVPFLNGEDQYEYRWIVEVMLQCNPIVRVGQQFADEVSVDLIEVEAAYT